MLFFRIHKIDVRRQHTWTSARNRWIFEFSKFPRHSFESTHLCYLIHHTRTNRNPLRLCLHFLFWIQFSANQSTPFHWCVVWRTRLTTAAAASIRADVNIFIAKWAATITRTKRAGTITMRIAGIGGWTGSNWWSIAIRTRAGNSW